MVTSFVVVSRVSEPWKKVVYHHYPKLGVICDTRDHFILAYQTGRGPRPDVDEFRPIMAEALHNVRFTTFVADAGYDSEANHRFARAQHGIRTMIPPKHGRPTTKPATGHYRRLMQVRFSTSLYRNRTQVETVISMIKRRQGSYVHGRKYQSQCRDLRLMVLTHNAMILLYLQVFYRAGQNYLSSLGEPGDFRGLPRARIVRSRSSFLANRLTQASSPVGQARVVGAADRSERSFFKRPMNHRGPFSLADSSIGRQVLVHDQRIHQRIRFAQTMQSSDVKGSRRTATWSSTSRHVEQKIAKDAKEEIGALRVLE